MRTSRGRELRRTAAEGLEGRQSVVGGVLVVVLHQETYRSRGAVELVDAEPLNHLPVSAWQRDISTVH